MSEPWSPIRLRVVDIETTGFAPPAEVIELGFVDVEWRPSTTRVRPPVGRLFRPLNGIPPQVSAIHHITPADIPADAPVATAERLREALLAHPAPDILVAHNCAFERRFIGTEADGGLPWICTFRAAQRIWPRAPSHSNQALRQWRGLALDPVLATPAHRAGPDAYVTAHLLAELLAAAPIERLVAWSSQPRPLAAIPFGKHRGLPWSAAPLDYLQWMSRQAEMDGNVLRHAKAELGRRDNAGLS
ncbi:MAG TPA: exonuclease domain-containing protein [Caulobacteraceae bacterium]|nr:exonuclease domain-containing protein [Caulobacteraceae bacterium]